MVYWFVLVLFYVCFILLTNCFKGFNVGFSFGGKLSVFQLFKRYYLYAIGSLNNQNKTLQGA